MDTARRSNFLLTSGGTMRLPGLGKTRARWLPMMAVPTTSGTGSEAQSYALVSDAETHVRMACGDRGRFHVAILALRLTVSQPSTVTASAGFDSISTRSRPTGRQSATPPRTLFPEAWRLLEANYERVTGEPGDIERARRMQLGAYWAGLAIENSSWARRTPARTIDGELRHGSRSGVGDAAPSLFWWNGWLWPRTYRQLLALGSAPPASRRLSEALALQLEELRAIGGLPRG